MRTHVKNIYIESQYRSFDQLIFFVASMAVLGFYFPPESGEKVTLEITILMSLTFFMNVVSDMQPPSSETPLIGTYFSCIMIMVASSVVCICFNNYSLVAKIILKVHTIILLSLFSGLYYSST